MALTARMFIFEELNSLKYVPKRVSEGLYAETDRLPQYAGKAMKAVEVILESEDKKPVRILDMRGHILTFDDGGRLVPDWDGFWGDHEPASERKANVVDLRPKIGRREWVKRNRWDLTSDHRDMIVAAIWPSTESARELSSVKGIAPKRPPMTYEGRAAFDEIRTALSGVGFALERLSEPALKGLAFEARRLTELDRDDALLLDAVASLADRRREIRARHRTGSGIWYAVVDIIKWDETHSTGEGVDVIWEKCSGKQAAVEATRRLLAANAQKFDATFSVEARVRCDLEWEPGLIDH